MIVDSETTLKLLFDNNMNQKTEYMAVSIQIKHERNLL